MPHPVDKIEAGLRNFGEKFRSSLKKLGTRSGLMGMDGDFDTFDKEDDLNFSESDHSSGGTTDLLGSRASLGLLLTEETPAEGEVCSTAAQRTLPPEVDEAVQAAARAIQEGRHLSAYTTLTQLVKQHALTSAELSSVCQHHDLNLWSLQSTALLLLDCLHDISSDKGWGRVTKGGLQSFYKKTKGSSIHSYRFHAVFNTHFDRLLALTREVDLHPTWTSTTLESVVLQQPSDRELYCYNVQWQPPPFKNLDVVFHSQAADLLEEDGSFLLTMTSVPQEQLPSNCQKLPKEATERQRILLRRGSCIRLKPLQPAADGSPRTLGEILFHVDPQGANMPPRLIKFVLKIIAPFVHRNVSKTLGEVFSCVSNPLPQRMNGVRWDFYQTVRSRVSEHTKSQALKSTGSNTAVPA